MFAFKSLIVATIMLIFSIIHYVFAVQPLKSCKLLLSKNNWEDHFEDGPNEGTENFIRAFNTLSFEKINSIFSIPPDTEESTQQELERTLTKLLTEEYFIVLFNDHQLKVTKKKTPLHFCVTDEDTFGPDADVPETDDELTFMLMNDKFRECMEDTEKMFAFDYEMEDVKLIFKRLYEHWDLDSINELGYYGIKYFNHWQGLLLVLSSDDGDFTSIHKYCFNNGKHHVRQKRYNL